MWVGSIDHVQVGGPCEPRTGQIMESEVRALIVGENLFAVRGTGGNVCTYVARIRGNTARGFGLCEGHQRMGFAVRFRTTGPGTRPRRPEDVRPDDELLNEHRSLDEGSGFRERGLDDWFPRNR